MSDSLISYNIIYRKFISIHYSSFLVRYSILFRSPRWGLKFLVFLFPGALPLANTFRHFRVFLLSHPLSRFLHQKSKIQNLKSSLPHPASSIQHRASRIEYRVSSIQYPFLKRQFMESVQKQYPIHLSRSVL